ncbi:MAG: LamG domain-containing protein, partial [Sedimentisphaerales bacterium]|nr:LamG domain-containing protein [Sedimentisphaerales bacterium]
MCKRLVCLISVVWVLGLSGTNAVGQVDPTLVGWWQFEEASGVLYDQSDNHNDGTPYNGVLYQQVGQEGYALGFDGVDDYVIAGTNGRPSDTFSFGAWLKTTATHQIEAEAISGTGGTSNQRYAFDPRHGGDQNGGAGLSIGTNGIAVYEHGSNYMPTTAAYPTELGDDWNHVMIVYDNKVPTIYLNGRAVHTGLRSPRAIVDAPFQFGGMTYGYFEGVMDEVRIYNRALSADEIKKMAPRWRAWGPEPAEGALYMNTWVSFSWEPGDFAVSHDVYFGDNFDEVSNATPASDAFFGNQAGTFFMVGFPGFAYPEGLVPGTTYYWR